MYKIGDFSSISKTTIKTLRYYEKVGLLKPSFIDPNTSYRYYESNQLIDVSKIISLRQAGLSIKDIKKILNGYDMVAILNNRKAEIEKNLINYNIELSKINYLLEGKNMENEIVFKELTSGIAYYKEGEIKDYSELAKFVLKTGEECKKLNPNLKCTEPGYCYINYLDGEYREKDIKIRYVEAVTEKGNEKENIKFMDLKPIKAVCIYHKGSYSNLRDSYNIIMKYIEDNGYEIIEFPRECYIDGCWNKENEEDYLTEIQVPVKKK